MWTFWHANLLSLSRAWGVQVFIKKHEGMKGCARTYDVRYDKYVWLKQPVESLLRLCLSAPKKAQNIVRAQSIHFAANAWLFFHFQNQLRVCHDGSCATLQQKHRSARDVRLQEALSDKSTNSVLASKTVASWPLLWALRLQQQKAYLIKRKTALWRELHDFMNAQLCLESKTCFALVSIYSGDTGCNKNNKAQKRAYKVVRFAIWGMQNFGIQNLVCVGRDCGGGGWHRDIKSVQRCARCWDHDVRKVHLCSAIKSVLGFAVIAAKWCRSRYQEKQKSAKTCSSSPDSRSEKNARLYFELLRNSRKCSCMRITRKLKWGVEVVVFTLRRNTA